jgi:hypothetical protein
MARPTSFNRCVGDDLYLARFGIDLDFADLGSVRKARDRKRLVGDAGEWTLEILWEILAHDGSCGNLEDANLSVRPGNTVSAALELDVDFDFDFASLELSGCPKLCSGQ